MPFASTSLFYYVSVFYSAYTVFVISPSDLVINFLIISYSIFIDNFKTLLNYYVKLLSLSLPKIVKSIFYTAFIAYSEDDSAVDIVLSTYSYYIIYFVSVIVTN